MTYRPNILLLGMCIKGWLDREGTPDYSKGSSSVQLTTAADAACLTCCLSSGLPSGPAIHSSTHQLICSSESSTILPFTQLLQLNSDPEGNPAAATAPSSAALTDPFLIWFDTRTSYYISISSSAPWDSQNLSVKHNVWSGGLITELNRSK